jgi:hypothetical protein
MNQAQSNQQSQRLRPPPQPPPPKYRFRRAILAVPLTIGAFFWFRNGVDASFQFQDILEYLNVRHEDRYARLACLGVLLIAVTAIVKHARARRK